MRKKSLFLVAFLMTLFIAPMIFISSYGHTTIPVQLNTNKEFTISADWYDESWHYRKQVLMGAGTDGAGTNYTIKVDITYDSDMQADFADIRFTDDDNVTLLDHWRESYIASTNATFWVKVTDSQNWGTYVRFYMYYGNEEASSLSNGTATFLFYEDWSSQSVDAWTVAPGQTDGQTTYSPTDATQGGYVAKVEGDAEDSYLIYTDYAHTASFATMFRANIEEASTGNLGRMGTGWAGAYGWAFVETSATTDERLSVYDDDENPDYQTMTSAYFDTWVTFQITRDGTETNLYADTVLIETASFAPDIISNPVCSIQVTDSEEDIYSDWVAVRKFVSSEPCVTSFGEEEDYLPPPEWEGAGTVIILFEVPVFTGSFDALLIFLGLIMIPASTLYLVKGGKDEMSTDKLFYFLIAFVIGWGLFLGGIYG